MSKHTPGPWEAERHGAVFAEVAGRRRQVACAQGDAVMHGDTETDVIELQRANAHLIAAAPELLNALEDMTLCGCAECMDAARAAIAKAKGEK